jgi:hypothetical protein
MVTLFLLSSFIHTFLIAIEVEHFTCHSNFISENFSFLSILVEKLNRLFKTKTPRQRAQIQKFHALLHYGTALQ